jgi:hypothetical protein
VSLTAKQKIDRVGECGDELTATFQTIAEITSILTEATTKIVQLWHDLEVSTRSE